MTLFHNLPWVNWSAAINFRNWAFSKKKKNSHTLRIQKSKIHTRVVIYTRTVVSCSYVLFLGIRLINSGVSDFLWEKQQVFLYWRYDFKTNL